MKKRLLISSVLMSAVLACALGTGTYAWYQAGSAGIASGTHTNAEIGTTDNSVSIDAITFTVTATPVNNEIAYTDVNGKSWYYNGTIANENKVDVTATSVLNTKVNLTVDAKLDGNTPTDGQLGAVAGTYSFTVKADSNSRIAEDVGNVYKAESIGATINVDLVVLANGDYSLTVTEFYASVVGLDEKQTGTDVVITVGAIETDPAA